MRFRRGKYKGQLISKVQQHDPGYIRWCKENTPWILKKPKVKAALINGLATLRADPAALIPEQMGSGP